MSTLIRPDSPALEAAKDYAWQLGSTLDEDKIRWIIEAFLDAESLEMPSSEVAQA